MRSRVDIALCFGSAEGDVSFPHVLGSGEGEWANLVSLLTGRYAHIHSCAAPGDTVYALTNLPGLLRGHGYRCQADDALALPFDWTSNGVDGPLLSAHAGPAVSRPDGWVVALKPDAAGRCWRVGVTPPGGAPRRVLEAPLSIVDVLPSICLLLGIAIPEDVQGKAIRALWQGVQPLPGDYGWAYAADSRGQLIWNGARGVLLDAEGNCRLLDAELQPVEGAPGEPDLTDLAAAMLRAQDPLPYPQRRYRVKRHPDNLWLDAAYRQRTDPGIPELPVVAQHRFRVRPVRMEGAK